MLLHIQRVENVAVIAELLKIYGVISQQNDFLVDIYVFLKIVCVKSNISKKKIELHEHNEIR